MNLSITFTVKFSGKENIELLERCDKIIQREKGNQPNFSRNKLIVDAVKEYEIRHGQGNSSFQLDKFGVTWTKAQAVGKCGFAGCTQHSVGTGLFTAKNQTYGLCSHHLKVARENPKAWSDLKCP